MALSADRKVTLANSAGSVDLIADLAGYYGKAGAKSLVPVAVPGVSGVTALGSNGYAITAP